jgi:hypothetical protein
MRTGVTVAGADLELTNIQREQLCIALTSAFPTRGELARLVNFKLDVDLEVVAGGETYSDVIFNLVRWAVAQGKVDALVMGARKQNPGNPSLRAFDEQTLRQPTEKAPENHASQAAAAVRTDQGVGAIVPPFGSLGGDAQFGFTDIELVVRWTMHLRQAGAAVCRLDLHDSMATAFLVGPDLVMTCDHVLEPLLDQGYYENPVTGTRKALTPDGVALRFGYTRAADGFTVHPSHTYRLAADWLVDSSPWDELDYVLLRVDGLPGTQEVEDDLGRRVRNWLHPSGAHEFQRQEPLYVLQHPLGMPLQVSYATGAVMNSQGTRVVFSTYTAPGSSGSPCLSARCELVGMYESKQDGLRRQAIPMAAIVGQPKVRAALAQWLGK